MNERIKEFRFKAGEYTNEQKPLGLMKWNEIRDAKFAELIVMECIFLFDGSKETKTTGLISHNQVVSQIKEHFGV